MFDVWLFYTEQHVLYTYPGREQMSIGKFCKKGPPWWRAVTLDAIWKEGILKRKFLLGTSHLQIFLFYYKRSLLIVDKTSSLRIKRTLYKNMRKEKYLFYTFCKLCLNVWYVVSEYLSTISWYLLCHNLGLSTFRDWWPVIKTDWQFQVLEYLFI